MGCFYAVSGEVRCRDCEESRELLAAIEDDASPDIEVVLQESLGEFVLRICGGQHCSYSTASDVDDNLKALGAFAIEAALIHTTCDDDDDDYWIGPLDQVAAGERKDRLDAARQALGVLNLDELAEVLQEYATPV